MGYQGEKLTKGIVSGPALLGLVYRLGEERERTMDKERLPQMYAGLRVCPAGPLPANGLGGVCHCPVVRRERVRVLTAPSYGFTRTTHPSGIQPPREIRQVRTSFRFRSDYHRRTSRPQA